ncbi:MAG TPA: MTH1187 family thiamine-binding protein [Nitrososphaera sp.]|nr:MTH1187 family thiamine-binding protein [Nitrososphaera sp.]
MSNLSTVNAEISITPIGTSDTSMGKEIAAAYNAIRNTTNLKKVTLTPMSTQIESNNLDDIFQAIHAAHNSAKSVGAKRVISTIRIDERLDKPNTLDGKVHSVETKIS